MDKVPASQRQLGGQHDELQRRLGSEHLRKANRIVIAATKTGSEKNATNFARYFAEALREPAADTDKNEIDPSALEAFPLRANSRRPSSYDTMEAPGHRAIR